MPSIIVGQGPPTEVSTGESGATFTNTGPATVSYSDSQNVRDVPEGMIAPTASVTLYGSVWLYASSRADVAYALLPSSVESGSGVPAGGTTGEVLAKLSDDDGDADWAPAAALSNDTPQAPGDAVPGTSDEASRADHVHADNGIYSTSGVPSDAVGGDGAWAIDIDTGRMYGPKADGAWPNAYFDIGAYTIVASAITDNFNRADDVVLGSTPGGAPWVALAGGGSIVSNEAHGGGTGFLNFASNFLVVESGESDGVVEVTLPDGTHGGEGVCFRAVDANNCWFVSNGRLKKRTAGVETTEDGGVTINPLVAGSKIKVTLNGASIIMESIPATSVVSITDAAHQTATQHGLYLAFNGDQLDDFSFDWS